MLLDFLRYLIVFPFRGGFYVVSTTFAAVPKVFFSHLGYCCVLVLGLDLPGKLRRDPF